LVSSTISRTRIILTEMYYAVIFIMPLWEDPIYDNETYQAAQTWLESVKPYTNALK
jgi:hypothetical protein